VHSVYGRKAHLGEGRESDTIWLAPFYCRGLDYFGFSKAVLKCVYSVEERREFEEQHEFEHAPVEGSA